MAESDSERTFQIPDAREMPALYDDEYERTSDVPVDTEEESDGDETDLLLGWVENAISRARIGRLTEQLGGKLAMKESDVRYLHDVFTPDGDPGVFDFEIADKIADWVKNGRSMTKEELTDRIRAELLAWREDARIEMLEISSLALDTALLRSKYEGELPEEARDLFRTHAAKEMQHQPTEGRVTGGSDLELDFRERNWQRLSIASMANRLERFKGASKLSDMAPIGGKIGDAKLTRRLYHMIQCSIAERFRDVFRAWEKGVRVPDIIISHLLEYSGLIMMVERERELGGDVSLITRDMRSVVLHAFPGAINAQDKWEGDLLESYRAYTKDRVEPVRSGRSPRSTRKRR
jgi:hypothetical protein